SGQERVGDRGNEVVERAIALERDPVAVPLAAFAERRGQGFQVPAALLEPLADPFPGPAPADRGQPAAGRLAEPGAGSALLVPGVAVVALADPRCRVVAGYAPVVALLGGGVLGPDADLDRC